MELTEIRLKYLLALLQTKENAPSVSGFARTFGVAKSTVSRTMDAFEQQGIVKTGTLELTEYGIRLGNQYLAERNSLVTWLMKESKMTLEQAKEDANRLVVCLSSEAKEVILNKIRMLQLKDKAKQIHGLDGSDVVKLLGDGRYQFPYAIYRDKAGKHPFLSMANKGFYHPAEVIIRSGSGLVKLRCKTIEGTSKLGLLLKGKVLSMKYMENKKFVECGHDYEEFYIPLGALTFDYNEEDGLLQASVLIRVTCTAGIVHMPESTAIFTMFL